MDIRRYLLRRDTGRMTATEIPAPIPIRPDGTASDTWQIDSENDGPVITVNEDGAVYLVDYTESTAVGIEVSYVETDGEQITATESTANSFTVGASAESGDDVEIILNKVDGAGIKYDGTLNTLTINKDGTEYTEIATMNDVRSCWTPVVGYTKTPASGGTITMTTNHTSWIAPGDAIRWRSSLPIIKHNLIVA